jgi:hypothetical protein
LKCRIRIRIPEPDSLNPDPQLCQNFDDLRILEKNGNNYEVALPWSSWEWRPAKPAAALLAPLFSPRIQYALEGPPLPPYVCNIKQKINTLSTVPKFRKKNINVVIVD